MDGRSVVDFFYYYGTGPGLSLLSLSLPWPRMAIWKGKDDRFTTQSHSNNRIQV